MTEIVPFLQKKLKKGTFHSLFRATERRLRRAHSTVFRRAIRAKKR